VGELRGVLGWINPADIIVYDGFFLRRNRSHLSVNAPWRGAYVVPPLEPTTLFFVSYEEDADFMRGVQPRFWFNAAWHGAK